MELWRELLIGGLQNETNSFGFINDKALSKLFEDRCYKILLQIKQILDNERLSDQDCFIKIEEIILTLEKNGIFCDRHDFG